ncbi:hypothetical protein OTU49_014787 [Cherax quadricarinatus]|uniref:Strictosidine synthase conserved region domain-containing protein n=1 Tax=Cherax quadricarinatus TaxID=27406 RepID=A0AAW0YF62_CHEQU
MHLSHQLMPVILRHDECLPLEGPLAKNNKLDAADRIMDGKIVGPESIASRDPEEIFVSLHGGKILRIWGPKFDHFKIVASIGPGCDGPWQEKVCGRPLGLRFAPDGRLLVADSYLGLFVVDVDTGEKEQLFDISQEIDGAVPKILDDIDVDAEGNIYWSDASTVCTLEDGLVEFLSDPSGRLLRFDPKTKSNTVLVKNVHFANGVQLSPDHEFILFCETFKNRVIRYWLKGPKAGQTEVFVDRLPGMPDNIRSNKNGGYYVSLIGVYSEFSRKINGIIGKLPLLRKLAVRLLTMTRLVFDSFTRIYPNQYTERIAYWILNLHPISQAQTHFSNLTIVVELDAQGNIINSLQGNSGKVLQISETDRVGNYLFFGSPYNKYLGSLYVGPSVIEVEGKGVKIKTGKEPALQREEQVNKKEIIKEEKDLSSDENVQEIVQEDRGEESAYKKIGKAEKQSEEIKEHMKLKQKVEHVADIKINDIVEKEAAAVESKEKLENTEKEEL